MLPTKFQVNWSFGSREEGKNMVAIWITDWTGFSFFWSTSHSDASYKVSSLLVQEKKWQTDFQDGLLDLGSEGF